MRQGGNYFRGQIFRPTQQVRWGVAQEDVAQVADCLLPVELTLSNSLGIRARILDFAIDLHDQPAVDKKIHPVTMDSDLGVNGGHVGVDKQPPRKRLKGRIRGINAVLDAASHYRNSLDAAHGPQDLEDGGELYPAEAQLIDGDEPFKKTVVAGNVGKCLHKYGHVDTLNLGKVLCRDARESKLDIMAVASAWRRTP